MSKQFRNIDKPIRKKDAMQLVTGKPVFTEDVVGKNDYLHVKLLRSPHASADIKSINTAIAKKVPGVEGVWTYEDVPQKRFTIAGQTYPEMSEYDRLILDRHIRMIGDPVAIVAAESEEAALKALKLIKVEYDVLEPILDMHEALDNPLLVHPEDDWLKMCDFVDGDNKRNLVAAGQDTTGDIDKVMSECDIVMEDTFHCKANSQAMMETFRTYAQIDTYGRLHLISSTQIIFHARRNVARALDIPISKVRVTKPRIGGGFGAKQSAVSEVYPAFVTWVTKKPSMIVFSRRESQIAGSPRHEMEVTVKIGAMNDGTIRAVDFYTLSNSGAYSEHGPTTVDLSCRKSIPLYTANLEAHRFRYDVVYTNIQAAGAFRGYGAPQGIFALETMVNRLARKLNMDECALREKNMLRQGQVMHVYHDMLAEACALDRCVDKCKEMFDWDNKPFCLDLGNGKVRSKGMALAMQGSAIQHVDVGGATVKLSDDGTYQLNIGAADMGTGCDTILAQMVAEVMECDVDQVTTYSADTDTSPYDSGSYASSTTYLTGKATVAASQELKENILKLAAQMLGEEKENLDWLGDGVASLKTGKKVTLEEIGTKSQSDNSQSVQVTATKGTEISPPPYMAAMVEIELDMETGEITIVDYVAVADPGTVINSNLARVQLEGGLVQGIGMALMEDITYSDQGRIPQSDLMNYKIPTRLDIRNIRTAFESSYQPDGPFGAKSIGEMVINTPCPAINDAIYNATGHYLNEVPFTPSNVYLNAILPSLQDEAK
jgi:CO/xanthine dehydrogenase Mo-binding subunit